MKSITLKDPETGEKLIKVFHNKKGYFFETRTDVKPVDCLIVTDNNSQIYIPARSK